MFTLFAIQSGFMTILTLVLFVVKAWAFIDALSRRPDAFVAADKMNKQGWLIILGLAVVVNAIFWAPGSILNLVGIVAAIVYLVDARPALRSVTGR